jgi:hypothetical protein
VFAWLEEPIRLIIETCIATGVRISEVLGLKWKHVDIDAATIKIEQRVWHQDVGRPKSEDSRRVLGIGDLAARFRAKAAVDGANPDALRRLRELTHPCLPELTQRSAGAPSGLCGRPLLRWLPRKVRYGVEDLERVCV